MVKQSRGTLSGKTRSLRGKSRTTVSRQVKEFKVGDKVILAPKANPDGMPHLRYRNRQGKIVEKRGRSYLVEIKDGNKKKKIIAGPIHLRKSGA